MVLSRQKELGNQYTCPFGRDANYRPAVAAWRKDQVLRKDSFHVPKTSDLVSMNDIKHCWGSTSIFVCTCDCTGCTHQTERFKLEYLTARGDWIAVVPVRKHGTDSFGEPVIQAVLVGLDSHQ
jgi:hypothetical protein